MQPSSSHHTPCFFLVVLVLALASVGLGCAARTYRAAKLPPELVAPASVDLEAIDLSGLANHSVSVEVIQPGDVLDVSMVTDYTKLTATTTAVRVADDGTVVIPLVGKVGVAGMKVEEAEQAVNAQSIMQGVFHNPCITVTMKQCRTHTVTVVGAVNKPGVRELPRGATSLMAALVAAKGLSKDAGTMVQIRHTDQRQGAINRLPAPQATDGVDPSATLASYQQSSSATATPAIATTTVDIAAAAGTIKVPELHDGDVVYVTKRTLRPIHVIGLVSKPGEFPYPTSREIRVLDALALAGGVSNPVAEDVVVIRQMPGAPEPARIVVSIQAAKNGRDNVALAPGDTVTVEQTPVTIVVDAIRTFFHFGVGTNMSWF